MQHDNCDLTKKFKVDFFFFFKRKCLVLKKTYFVCKNNAQYNILGIYSSIPIYAFSLKVDK